MSGVLPRLPKSSTGRLHSPQGQGFSDAAAAALGLGAEDCSDATHSEEAGPAHKVKAARNVNNVSHTASVTSLQGDRRFWPRDMRGLLEVYEQGVTLQQGMKSHCDDTVDAMGGLAGRCENAVSVLVSRMEKVLSDIREQIDKPANVDWTCVLDALAKIDGLQPGAIGEDVDARLNAHTESIVEIENRLEDKLTAQIYGMDNSMEKRHEGQCEEMEQVRQELRATQELGTSIKGDVKKTEEQLTEAFSHQHHALKADFAQTLQDVLRVQEKNRRADMAKVEPLLEEQLGRVLAEHHENLKLTVAKNIEDILEVQSTQAKQIAQLEPWIKNEFQRQFEQQKLIDSKPRFQINEIHKTVHDDVSNLFNEIGAIQRAMNLDYVQPRQDNKTHDQTRLREFMTQTESPPMKDGHTQSDEAYFKHQRKKLEQKRQANRDKANKAQVVLPGNMIKNKKKSGYGDHEKKKAKMREALIKPSYNVTSFYHTTGWSQEIARSQLFENFTFFIILLNAIWIAVDTDHNDALVLIDAHPVFQIMENVFCSYFFFELVIRFISFEAKRNCLKDTWFVFDATLLVGMVVETWVISLTLLFMSGGSGGSTADGMGNFSMLRMARLVKMLRMARMARLLRMVPELVVILKSIGAAFRSALFFLLLTVIILYVYAVAFKQLTRDTHLGRQYFQSVPMAMNSLMLEGMLPIYSGIVTDVSNENAWYWPLIITFILLASITVMNMLVGVLVEVVRTVAEREREAMTVIHVTNELREVMHHFMLNDMETKICLSVGPRQSFAARFSDNRASISEMTKGKVATDDIPDMSKESFETFLATPGVISLLQDCGVDALVLLDSIDMIFEEKGHGQSLRFVDLVEVVLNMRGTNPATVKDVKEQMRLVKMSTQEAALKTNRLFIDQFKNFRNDIMMSLHELRRMVDSDAGSDDAGSRLGWGDQSEADEEDEALGNGYDSLYDSRYDSGKEGGKVKFAGRNDVESYGSESKPAYKDTRTTVEPLPDDESDSSEPNRHIDKGPLPQQPCGDVEDNISDTEVID